MRIRVLFTGRSYEAASELPDELTLPDDSSVNDAIRAVSQLFPDDRPLPPSCLVSISGRHIGTVSSHEDLSLRDGDEVALIAPVAGG
jgi:molybdopterin converting factor small subunit